MNKILCLISLISLVTITMTAQIQIGALGGPGMSRVGIVGDEDVARMLQEQYFVPTFHLGAFTRYPIGKKFQTEIELKFSRQGTKVKFSSSSNSNYGSYLYMPISVRYLPIKQIGLEFGADIGIALQHYYLKSIHPIELGLHTGLAYHINNKLSVGLRYTHALNNLVTIQITDIDGQVTGSAGYQNRLLECTVKHALITFEKKATLSSRKG